MAKEVFSTSRAPRPNELVIFDFDGTLCLGDDPVLTYAQLVDDAIAARGLPDAAVRDAVQRGLDAGNLNIPEINSMTTTIRLISLAKRIWCCGPCKTATN